MEGRAHPRNVAHSSAAAQGKTRIAVDVGNTRIKLGFFARDAATPFPEPLGTMQTSSRVPDFAAMGQWLGSLGILQAEWWIGSVNRAAATRLIDHLRTHRADDRITLLAAGDLPLRVALERPDMVGVDRLLDALAANALRSPRCAAVVVDVGSAITVDLLSAEGEFQGGAILPGLSMSARALHEFTDMLPLLEMSDLNQQTPAVGRATLPAMRSGLFWGAVGAIRELVARMPEGCVDPSEVFITGGAGPVVADLLGPTAKYIPHLTISGIALAACSASHELA